MCFVLSEFDNKVHIAKQDIICFKVSEIVIGNDICLSLIKGYRYMKDIIQPKVRLMPRNKLSNSIISEGYHSYMEEFGCNVVFKIPKGTRFYINNENGEYVSNTIIYLGPKSGGFHVKS